jgi:hypothetical protein
MPNNIIAPFEMGQNILISMPSTPIDVRVLDINRRLLGIPNSHNKAIMDISIIY